MFPELHHTVKPLRDRRDEAVLETSLRVLRLVGNYFKIAFRAWDQSVDIRASAHHSPIDYQSHDERKELFLQKAQKALKNIRSLITKTLKNNSDVTPLTPEQLEILENLRKIIEEGHGVIQTYRGTRKLRSSDPTTDALYIDIKAVAATALREYGKSFLKIIGSYPESPKPSAPSTKALHDLASETIHCTLAFLDKQLTDLRSGTSMHIINTSFHRLGPFEHRKIIDSAHKILVELSRGLKTPNDSALREKIEELLERRGLKKSEKRILNFWKESLSSSAPAATTAPLSVLSTPVLPG